MANEASVRSLKKIGGFIKGKELIDRGLTFWTITIWESDRTMKHFRNNGPHKRVMRKLPRWCNEAAYIHWIQEDAEIPGWNALHTKLISDGKLTKVKYPSAKQPGMNYPAPAWTKTERTFRAPGKDGMTAAEWPG